MNDDYLLRYLRKPLIRGKAPSVIAEIHSVNYLVSILRVCGFSIHDIINHNSTRQLIAYLYKTKLAIDRKNQELWEKEYQEWLEWCVEMGCPKSILEGDTSIQKVIHV